MYIYSSKCTFTACVVSASRELGSHFFRPGLHFFRPGSQSIYSPLSAQPFAGRTAAPPPPVVRYRLPPSALSSAAATLLGWALLARRRAFGQSRRDVIRSTCGGRPRKAEPSRRLVAALRGKRAMPWDRRSLLRQSMEARSSLFLLITCPSSTAAGDSRAWRARGTTRGGRIDRRDRNPKSGDRIWKLF